MSDPSSEMTAIAYSLIVSFVIEEQFIIYIHIYNGFVTLMFILSVAATSLVFAFVENDRQLWPLHDVIISGCSTSGKSFTILGGISRGTSLMDALWLNFQPNAYEHSEQEMKAWSPTTICNMAVHRFGLISVLSSGHSQFAGTPKMQSKHVTGQWHVSESAGLGI